MNTVTPRPIKTVIRTGLLLLAGSTAIIATAQASGDELSARQIADKTRAAYAALSSYSDSGKVVYAIAGQNLTATFDLRLARPGLYRVDWAQEKGLQGVVWSQGDGDFLQVDPGSPASAMATASLAAAGLKNDPNPQRKPSRNAALSQAAGLSFTAAATIPGIFFNQSCGDIFISPIIAGQYPVKREKDETINGVDCYVIATEIDLSTTTPPSKPGTESATLWIGKSDFLIHQDQVRYAEKVDEQALSSDAQIDEACKKSLEMQHQPVTPEAIAALRPQMRTVMKQVQSTLKAGFAKGIVTTQTHDNIVINRSLTASDFAR